MKHENNVYSNEIKACKGSIYDIKTATAVLT